MIKTHEFEEIIKKISASCFRRFLPGNMEEDNRKTRLNGGFTYICRWVFVSVVSENMSP